MIYRCPACRTRRSTAELMLAHQVAHAHTWCLCPGPAWSAAVGKHRPGTAGCHLRDDLQRSADAAWGGGAQPMAVVNPEEIPF